MDNSKKNSNTEKTAKASQSKTVLEIVAFGKDIEAFVSNALGELIEADAKADYSQTLPDTATASKALNIALSLTEKLDTRLGSFVMELLKVGKKKDYETSDVESIEQASNIRAKYLKVSSLLRLSLVGLYHSNEPFQEGVPSSCLLQVRDLLEVVAGLVAQVGHDLKSLHLIGEDEELGGMSVTVIEPRFL